MPPAQYQVDDKLPGGIAAGIATPALTGDASSAAGGLSEPVVIVLEGQARRGATEGASGGVEVVHAAGEGDDTLATLAASSPHPVTLVTADRGLAERARKVGADVVGPRWLLDRLGY